MGTFPFKEFSYHFSRVRVQGSENSREPWRQEARAYDREVDKHISIYVGNFDIS